MTFLAATIWNQVAREQELQTEAAKVAFRLNPAQLAKLDDHWMKFEKAAKTPQAVARCLPMCLPLLLETEALSGFVSQHPELRNAIPEILDAKEAALLMGQEYRLTSDDQRTLTQLLQSPEPAQRWLRAAQAVQR
jgi:hypothetical protein